MYQAVEYYWEMFFVFVVSFLHAFVFFGITQVQKHMRQSKFEYVKDGRELLQINMLKMVESCYKR